MIYSGKKYKIEKVEKMTDDVSFFKVKGKLTPKPGQFLQVSVPGVGESPLDSAIYEKDCVGLVVKNVGSVTGAMFQKKEGDYFYIRGPYGNGFPLEELKGKNIIAVAAGTGIAPVSCFIDYALQNRKDFLKIFGYLGFRNEKSILMKRKINSWEKKIDLFVGLSREKNHKHEKGFVQDIIDKHHPSVKDTVAILCGPEKMMEAVTKELNKIGIKNKSIYWATERRMECGFGSCGRCQLQDLYVCRDGPIFRYDVLKKRLDNENYSNKIKDKNEK